MDTTNNSHKTVLIEMLNEVTEIEIYRKNYVEIEVDINTNTIDDCDIGGIKGRLCEKDFEGKMRCRKFEKTGVLN